MAGVSLCDFLNRVTDYLTVADDRRTFVYVDKRDLMTLRYVADQIGTILKLRTRLQPPAIRNNGDVVAIVDFD